MSEQQHTFVEHERTLKDPVELALATDASLVPTAKMTALKKSGPLSVQQTPFTPPIPEQEQPIELPIAVPAVQQVDMLVETVDEEDDGDFSEIDIDIVEMISYALSRQKLDLPSEVPLSAEQERSEQTEETTEEIDTTASPEVPAIDSDDISPLIEEAPEEPLVDSADLTKTPDTPPASEDEQLSVEEPVEEAVEEPVDRTDIALEQALPTAVQPLPKRQPVAVRLRKYKLLRRDIVSFFLLVLLLADALVLWGNLTATHVYLSTLDPHNGRVLTEQDTGGYQDTITLTAPVYQSSSVYVGIHSNNLQGTHQVMSVMSVAGNHNSWHVTGQFSVPLAQGTLSGTSDGHLFAASANGLRVMTSGGHVLWSLQAGQPAQGTHPYEPVSDGGTLYAVASLQQHQVAAYDLRNGMQRWLGTLDDTLKDSPPFLLDENTLYVASDHDLYALNALTGTLLWEKPYPSRTLLLENEGGRHLLLAAGAQGLIALDTHTGTLAWSFDGQPGDTFTPAQFYQATMASTSTTKGNVVYATGILWQMPQVQEQVWLYAVDAATGALLWSRQVASGSLSADAGRTLLPVVDTTHGIVVLQQQITTNQQRITAFDINTGASHWNTLMEDIISSAPPLVHASDGTLILFTTVLDSRKVLFTASRRRIFLIVILLLTLTALLFSIWKRLRSAISYLQPHSEQFGQAVQTLRTPQTLHTLHTLRHYAFSPFQRFAQLSRLARVLVIFFLLSIFVVGGTVGYTRLNQFQDTLYQITAQNGTIQWQEHVTGSLHTLATDAGGSIITTRVGEHLYQLQAIARDGTVRWKSFSSQGIFSVPTIASPPGTLVIELRGDTPPAYQFAPTDVAYPYTIDHLLVLYIFNRSTGAVLWQHILVYPDEQQHAVILGADNSYIYVASTQTRPAPGSKGTTIQLFAVNRNTGTIDWRVFGPTEPYDGPHDDGQLLLREGQALWQVAGTIYAIDTAIGQIEWRRQIADDDLSVLVQEDRMTEIANTLVVMRRHAVHGLDPITGNELWSLPSKGSSIAQSAAGVIAADRTILVYGNGQIEAFDVTDRHSLWKHNELDTIQHLSVSDDGKTVYLIEVSNVKGSSPALVALDAQTGTTQWTFEPAGLAAFPLAPTAGFFSHNGMLFVTLCIPFGQDPCSHQRLYALTAATGKAVWTFTGYRFSDLHISQDGKTLLFNVNSSPWIDLLAHLKG